MNKLSNVSAGEGEGRGAWMFYHRDVNMISYLTEITEQVIQKLVTMSVCLCLCLFVYLYHSSGP